MTDLSGVFNQMDSRKDKTLKALRHWLREIRSEYDASKYDSDATLAELFRTYATQTQDWIAEINALDTITDTPPPVPPAVVQAEDGGAGVTRFKVCELMGYAAIEYAEPNPFTGLLYPSVEAAEFAIAYHEKQQEASRLNAENGNGA
jgi:hypothetical protein